LVEVPRHLVDPRNRLRLRSRGEAHAVPQRGRRVGVAEPEGPCAACAAAEAPWEVWRVLGPEDLVLAVPGVLASAAAERPGERIHARTALEARGILADHVDVHSAVSKLRRRYA
jgi:hypothetical protein